MGRLQHLRQSLPMIAALPGVACVVVDYGCPDGAGDWVQSHFPAVTVARARGVRYYCAAKARNLGSQYAYTPWICFVDADTLVGPRFHLDIRSVLRDNAFFLADPCPHALAGLVVCRLDDFRRIGGYDELFAGWGSEDRDLYERLARLGLARASLPARDIRAIPHGDIERTRHHAIGDRFLSLRINGMYFQIKHDLARLTGQIDLALRDRQALYERVRDRVLSQPQSPATLEVTLPGHCDFTQPPDWRLRRTIRYSFESIDPGTAP